MQGLGVRARHLGLAMPGRHLQIPRQQAACLQPHLHSPKSALYSAKPRGLCGSGPLRSTPPFAINPAAGSTGSSHTAGSQLDSVPAVLQRLNHLDEEVAVVRADLDAAYVGLEKEAGTDDLPQVRLMRYKNLHAEQLRLNAMLKDLEAQLTTVDSAAGLAAVVQRLNHLDTEVAVVRADVDAAYDALEEAYKQGTKGPLQSGGHWDRTGHPSADEQTTRKTTSHQPPETAAARTESQKAYYRYSDIKEQLKQLNGIRKDLQARLTTAPASHTAFFQALCAAREELITQDDDETGPALLQLTADDVIFPGLPRSPLDLGQRYYPPPVLVRRCWKELRDRILQQGTIVVIGTPGIGKSLFAWWFIRCVAARGFTVVYRKEHASQTLMCKDGRVQAGDHSAFYHMHADTNTWWVYDDIGPDSLHVGRRILMVSSPDRDRYKLFEKAPGVRAVEMPPWTLEETQLALKHGIQPPSTRTS